VTDPIARAAAAAREAYDGVRDLPVVGPAQRADLEQHIRSRYRFDAPQDAAEVVADVVAMLRRGSVHVTHPAYFGLFNPSVLPETVAAATLVAAFNPQTAAWTHNPAAFEMERHALRFLASRIGYAPDATLAHFCSGGQEANTTAVVVALTRAFPEVRERGVRAIRGEPTLYVSAEAHHSFEKAAHVAGIGRGAVRRIAVDDRLRMDVAALAAALRDDRAAGSLPFLVVGTAGTTSSGAIDPLPEIADASAADGTWFHCDAAWAGGALLSPRLRTHLAGIERADSVTWDAHKWLQVPLGTGMYFTPHRDALVAAFSTDSGYMPPSRGGVIDPFSVSHQWSRRAAGLPLFVALATRGAGGYEAIVDGMAAAGDLLREKLRAAGWVVVNETPLPLVNFTHPRIERGDAAPGDLVREIHRRGRTWISPTVLADGRRVLRACVTSFRTEERDLDVLVGELNEVFGA
jgi:glutamate/tyrosine decarboxylase-like PLP-dependent enzyme